LLQADLRSGALQAAQARYQGKYPELFQEGTEILDNYPAAIDVAMLLRELGDAAGARLLLQRSLAYLESLPESDLRAAGVHRARAQAMLGDGNAAIATLEQTVDAGWHEQWYFFLDRDLAFDDIRGEPRFQALVTRVQHDIAAQLAIVRQMEARGDIPLPATATR